MRATRARVAVFISIAALAAACAPVGNSTPESSSSTGGLTADQRSAGWRPLFDGNTSQWRGYKQQTFPASWRLVDGVLTKSGPVEDIITRQQFGNFELAFDWKLSQAGNAGVFYRGTEEYDHVYWSAPEYQLLDDANHPDGKSRLTSAGAGYALYPAPAGAVRPADQWNSSLIVVQGQRVQHWLNGQKLLEFEMGSPEWEAKVKASKFVEYPHYGRAARGYLALQGDHDGTLSIRNMRIKELP
jgi:hypothetical protein